MHPVNPLLTPAQNIPGLPQQVHAEIIHCATHIDLNNQAGSQELIDYLNNIINTAVNGDDQGGQGLEYFIGIIGQELATLSYIQTALEQVGDNLQVVATEQVDIPDLPLIQHQGLGQAVVASHHIMESWNHAVDSGNINPAHFQNLATVQNQLADLANSFVQTRNGLLDLQALLP